MGIIDTDTGILLCGDAVAGDNTLQVLFAGDFFPGNRTESLILSDESARIIEEICQVLESKDISVINLETTLTKSENPIKKDGPNLRVHPTCVDFMEKGQFDVASCANNHIGDFGPDQVIETIQHVHGKGIATVGAGKNLEEARKPLLIDKNGIRVAILAFAENQFGAATVDRAGFNPLDVLRNIKDIRAAAAEVDVTIVVVHDGNEYNPVPSPRIKQTYRAFAEAGASVVVAGHTHCPQGIEVWEGVPIIYSIGNFLFDKLKCSSAPGRFSARKIARGITGFLKNSALNNSGYDFWWVSYMVKITFQRRKACRIEVVPFSFDQDKTAFQLYRGRKKKEFINYLNIISSILQDEEEANRYWEAWCVKMGPQYITRTGLKSWPIDINDENEFRNLLMVRQFNTAESAAELVRRFLYLASEGRIDNARQYIPLLNDLQQGRIHAQNEKFLADF